MFEFALHFVIYRKIKFAENGKLNMLLIALYNLQDEFCV